MIKTVSLKGRPRLEGTECSGSMSDGFFFPPSAKKSQDIFFFSPDDQCEKMVELLEMKSVLVETVPKARGHVLGLNSQAGPH